MTVAVNDRRREHPGNGVATVFNGPMAYQTSHIAAYLVDDVTGVSTQIPGASLNVTLLGREGGTNVEVLSGAPASGVTLVLLRQVPISQVVDITNQGAFNPNVIERGYDLLCMQIQQIDDRQGRTLQWPETLIGTFNPNLPPWEAGKYLIMSFTDPNSIELGDPAGSGDLLLRTDLASGASNKGSTLVTYLQESGLARAVADVLADRLSLKGFPGIDPTGVAESSTGINAGLAYAKTLGKSGFLPAGIYRTTAPILVPGGTALEGEGWQPYTAYATTATLGKGTILHINHTGVGILVQKDGVNRTSGVRIAGIAMYWNHAVPGPGWVPTVYDWAIKVDRADDVTVEDVLMVNPYKGIQITGTALEPAGRLNLSRVFGQPFSMGVEIDLSVDVTSLDRVHFWPFWSDNANVLSWMKANNATFLKSNRSDNTELTNLFGYGYKYGIWLSSNAVGVTQRMRGQGIDFDDTVRAFWCDATGDVSSGSFTNFNATANPATAGADLFVSEGDGVDFNFANLRLSNSQQSTMLVTGVNARVRAVNVFADQWNIVADGSAAFNAGAGATIDILNHRFGTSNGGPMVGGPGTINIEEWISYTPIISAQAGTITTASGSGRYRRRPKQVDVQFDATITTNGTGATAVIATLPVQAGAFAAVLAGRERNSLGHAVTGTVMPNATQVVLKKYDDTYPGANATIITMSGSYESV